MLPDRRGIDLYESLLGLEVTCDEYVEAFDCDCVFLGGSIPYVELVIPHAGFLKSFNNGGGGLHHSAFSTPDLVRHMREFADGKGRWLLPSPVPGARNMLVNFLAPRHLGIMIEFVQEAD